MTIAADTDNRESYTGTGTTGPFSFPHTLMGQADLALVKVLDATGAETAMVLDTDYTLSGTADSVGRYVNGVDITTTAVVAAGYTLVAYGDPAITQTLDLVENDPFPAEETEKMGDRIVLICRRLKDLINRSFRLADSDTSGASLILPAPEGAALIGWDSAGTALQNYASGGITDSIIPSAFIETLLDDVNAAAARTTLGAATSGAATASGLTMTTARLLGRTTASTGAPEEITVGAGLSLAAGALSATVPRSYLAGLTLSTAGSSTTMSIAAGQATDSTNAKTIAIAAFAKTTSAWAAGTGNGGLDTGAIANSTWYHFYVISKTDGTTDALFSLSASSPTMPAGYTYKRRIGSGKTNGSAQWVLFKQTGDYVRWSASVLDVNTTNPGTSSVTAALASVPTGVKVRAIISAQVKSGSGAPQLYVRDLDASDEAVVAYNGTLGVPGVTTFALNAAATISGAQVEIMTDTSAQVGYRVSASGASDVVGIVTYGWVDRRGRDD